MFIRQLLDYFCDNIGIPDNNPRSNFHFASCVGKRIIWWDEPELNPLNIENVKLLFGGQKLSVEVKYQSTQPLERTPVFCASNKYPGHSLSDSSIMQNRCYIFEFKNVVDSSTDMEFTKEDYEIFFYGASLFFKN